MTSSLERAFLTLLKYENLPLPETQVRFAPPRRWKADFLWPDHRLIVEVHGGTWTGGGHVRGKQFESDCEKANTAQLLGFTYLAFTTDMVHDGRAIATVKEALEVRVA